MTTTVFMMVYCMTFSKTVSLLIRLLCYFLFLSSMPVASPVDDPFATHTGDSGKKQVPLKTDPENHSFELFNVLDSNAANLAACISADAEYIVFQSNRDNRSRFYLYQTWLDKTSGFITPQRIKLDAGARFEGQPFFSDKDGKIFYTSVSPRNIRDPNKVNIPADIWYTRFVAGKWQKPRQLPVPVNTMATETTAWVSYDGKELYFASDRAGGYGGLDLWVSRFKNGGWQKPVNMGLGINSGANEVYPRLHPDNRMLYFSSDRENGVGGYDIYTAKKSGNTYKDTENAGSFINSKGNDFFNGIPADASYALVTREVNNVEKIYKLQPVPGHMHNEAVAVARLLVIDAKSGRPLSAMVEIRNIETSQILYQKKHIAVSKKAYQNLNKAGYLEKNSLFQTDGIYLPLKRPGRYQIFVTIEGYLFADELLEVKPADRSMSLVIQMQKIKSGARVAMRTVLFEPDSAKMTEKSKKRLYRVAGFLRKNSEINIELQGHTASSFDYEKNMKLSKNRALKVKDVLVDYGIAAERLTIRGYADSKPVADNSTAEGRRLNRRVEFEVK